MKTEVQCVYGADPAKQTQMRYTLKTVLYKAYQSITHVKINGM